jgi:hypothetical protein
LELPQNIRILSSITTSDELHGDCSIEKGGWGARDRTWECRNQNPVPYRLATPQCID